MSQLRTNAIVDASGGTTATVNGYAPTLSNMAGRNRIINGDMRIDQRNAGASVTPTSVAGGTYSLDRWSTYGSVTSKFSVQRNAGSVTPPSGYSNYLGITSLSSYSVGAGEFYYLYQSVEGFNVSDFAFGFATASPVTLSFWVRSSITGTFSGTLSNGGFDRSYPFTYTINAANTWEQKTVTVAGDTTGTWTTSNGTGMNVFFNLGSGSNNLATAGAWTAAGRVGATGSQSIVATNGATFYITGVQLEAGSIATPFERRLIGTELALCQRYFSSSFITTIAPTNNTNGESGIIFANIVPYSSSYAYADAVLLPVSMRTPPTITIYNSSAIATAGRFAYYNGAWQAAIANNITTTRNTSFSIEPQGSFTAFVPLLGSFAWSADAEL